MISSNRFRERIRSALEQRTPADEAATALAVELDARAGRESTAGRLERKADEARVPRDADLRRVCLCNGLVVTAAMRAFGEAVAWRDARRTPHGTAKCVRVVSGPAGVGKTSGMARVAVHHAGTSAFVSSTEVVCTPRNGFSTNEESWQRWLAVDLLAVDDAGAEVGDPAVIRSLLVMRYDAGRVTLATTNLAKDKFVERFFDARLSDRLANGQRKADLPWFVAVDGDSLRSPDALAALARRAT